MNVFVRSVPLDDFVASLAEDFDLGWGSDFGLDSRGEELMV